jgi:hypothetical protein
MYLSGQLGHRQPQQPRLLNRQLCLPGACVPLATKHVGGLDALIVGVAVGDGQGGRRGGGRPLGGQGPAVGRGLC